MTGGLSSALPAVLLHGLGASVWEGLHPTSRLGTLSNHASCHQVIPGPGTLLRSWLILDDPPPPDSGKEAQHDPLGESAWLATSCCQAGVK